MILPAVTGNGMTKKRMGTKRPRAGAHRRKSVLNTRMRDNPVDQTEMFWTIKARNFFRRAIGTTTGDIRSFQLCITNSGYYTVYLKDLPATDARRP
jgi:hypothetical protein